MWLSEWAIRPIDAQATQQARQRFLKGGTIVHRALGRSVQAERPKFRERWRVVVADAHLPGINGLEATRRIVTTHPDTCVIVFSTHSAADYAGRARDAGALGFITKADLARDVLAQVWTERHCNGHED